MVILENLGESRRHQGLSEADHIANKDTATLIEMVGGDLDGGHLVIEKAIAELGRNSELRQSSPSLLRQVVSHLEIDVIGRNRNHTRPTLLDDLDQLFGDIDAPLVIPPILEPFGQLECGIMVHHIDVQLALEG